LAELPIFYLDANVLLAYLNGESGRADVVEDLLATAADGELRLVSSAVSIVEVAFAAHEKTGGSLDPGVEHRIEALWHPQGPVRLVEAHRSAMLEARSLIRRELADGHGRLTPLDAVHLATAKIVGAERIFTYERACAASWSRLVGIPVEEPWTASPRLFSTPPEGGPAGPASGLADTPRA
jgi:predicted nucleic acid-binding protein